VPEAAPTRLLFVCLGNICRSPLAEGLFLHVAREQNCHVKYRVDSAGTGDWHIGELADPRSRAVAKKYGVELTSRARQVKTPQDFQEFDWIFGMDQQNQRDLLSLAPSTYHGKIRLIRSFDPECDADAEVPDPYYGGPEGFESMYAMLRRSCLGLLNFLENRVR